MGCRPSTLTLHNDTPDCSVHGLDESGRGVGLNSVYIRQVKTTTAKTITNSTQSKVDKHQKTSIASQVSATEQANNAIPALVSQQPPWRLPPLLLRLSIFYKDQESPSTLPATATTTVEREAYSLLELHA